LLRTRCVQHTYVGRILKCQIYRTRNVVNTVNELGRCIPWCSLLCFPDWFSTLIWVLRDHL
jgi:hypothetical protein